MSIMPTLSAAERQARLRYVDLFRGLLIAHMALDHASLFFNARRPAEELAGLAPPVYADLFQFLTRFTGVPVAPAFFFMAGFMVALTSAGRAARGVAEAEITRRLVLRGLVLIAVDALVMGIPRALMGFYSFAVLSSVGAGIIIVALLRYLSSKALLAGVLLVFALHPLLDVSALPVALRAVLHEAVRSGGFRSLYPVIPWAAIVVLGFIVGRDSLTRRAPVRFWLLLAGICLALFMTIRLPGGYGNAFAHSGPGHLDFWLFAKYPPDLPFLAWGLFAIFLSLAALRAPAYAGVPTLLQPFEAFGRVPFFFYVVHFYVLGIAATLIRGKVGLPGVYLIWLAVLALMLWPCQWYYRKKRDRPNLVTRYF